MPTLQKALHQIELSGRDLSSPTLFSYNLVLKTFKYALDPQIPLYYMDQGIPFADSMPRSASIDTTYMEERSVLSS